MSLCIVLVTCGDSKSAKQMAHELVQAKAAACVNIIPAIESIYYWDGKIQNDNEALLVIKTDQSKIKFLEEKVLKLHSYTTPEFVVLNSQYVGEKYHRWLRDYLEIE